MKLMATAFFALLVGAAPIAAMAAPPSDAVVERDAANAVIVRWSSPDPVDVFVSPDRDAGPDRATLVDQADRDGAQPIVEGPAARSYVILRNARTGETTRVAERLVPLQGGSNFRDIGGYAAADGRHVRWGMIYRSGATPLLTATDLDRIHALGLADMIDLRSDEERALAPSRIDGVAYAAVGYSMNTMMQFMGSGGNGSALYRRFPQFLAPQLRIVFDKLKRHQGPLVFNCSAGQDRTGFTTAVILSALGVPRETILKDYHLSTRYRQPKNEMPHLDPAQYASSPAAAYFARFQNPPAAPSPLLDPDGTPYLSGAFAEIDAKWGSVNSYLQHEIGVSAKDLAVIRATYLE